MTPKQPDVLRTLADLVRINSVNPAYEGGQSEAGIVGYLSRFFQEHGIATRLEEALPGRPNLIAVVPGRRSGRCIVFEAHTDTVSVEGMTIPPFEPVVTDGRLHGRGSCDTKAGLAAMMHALVSLRTESRPPPCEIWLVAAADEEHSFRGVVKLIEGLRSQAAAAVVAEPTDMRVVIATKGCVRFRVTCRGRAAHSSKPHLGVNAISHMAEVIRVLEEDAATNTRQHPLLGGATINVGLIKGGAQVNVVPDTCTIEVDRRLLPGEDPAEIIAGYRRRLEQLRTSLSALDVVIDPPLLADWPLDTQATAAIAALASRVLGDAGLPPEPIGVPFGTDASKLSRAGIPSIVLGPGSIDQAHSAVEYVECAQVIEAEACYRRLMLELEVE